MSRRLLLSLALYGLFDPVTPQLFPNSTNSTSTSSASVNWLGEKPTFNYGTTFGLPWPQGQYYPGNTTFTVATSSNEQLELQTWVTGQWLDGSVKWTGHAIAASDSLADKYTVTAQKLKNSTASPYANKTGSLTVVDTASKVTVNTGKLTVSFPKTGSILVDSIQGKSGKVIGQNGHLILQSQSGIAADSSDRANSSIKYFNFLSNIDNVTVSEQVSVRALVTVRGTHQVQDGGAHDDWLPFVLRFYLYANSDSIRLIHSLVFDGAANEDLITGVGIRFSVPLEGEEQYDRHIRFAGVDGGLFSEAVQGITGLRRDPGQVVRTAQVDGDVLPPNSTWDVRVSSRLRWIPTWGDYSLSQLSSDGFTLKKRTKAGQSWLNIPGGTRAGGLAYLGGATKVSFPPSIPVSLPNANSSIREVSPSDSVTSGNVSPAVSTSQTLFLIRVT